MPKPIDSEPQKWTLDQLKGIVAAGMPLADARMLLEDGYRPEDVLELAQMQAAQKASAASTAMSDAAKAAAEHTEKVRNPSNKTHPGISDMSYPEGDRARPRPTIPYEFLYNGYPMHKFPETQHYRELELARLVQPGEFKVMRKDYSEMKVTVRAERDANDAITKIDLQFPVSREDKPNIPAQAVVLYQLAHAGTKPTRQLFLEAMTEWLNLTLASAAVA